LLSREIKILIVEDDIIVAADLRQQLMKTSNHIVLKPTTRAEGAVDIACRERPDLILMDIVLNSKNNGLKAAHEILNTYKPVIIFLSGYIDDAIANEIHAMGCYHLNKPYNVKSLNELISEITTGHQSQELIS
jgi:CheY-like chemotaxis protein